MPKIDAPSLAEHRAARRRALLDAAHELLKAKPEAPALGDIAERAGVARSSVYQYCASRRDLLAALAVAEMINGMVHAGTRLLESGHGLDEVRANLLAVLGPFVAAHGGARS